MKAMILAAGVGSRLRPLTDQIPKALIEVGGVPILEVLIRRLAQAGVREIILNLFHRSEQIVDFLKAKKYFGMRIEFSREDRLLDTGGGLKKAAWFFDDGRPFFLHNADILTDLDLTQMVRFHIQGKNLITLAVRKRKTGRTFLFGPDGLLRGRQSPEGGVEWAGPPLESAERLAFDGIHVLSPNIFSKMNEEGVFPIHQTYLRLAGEGERIKAFLSNSSYWKTIGDLPRLEEARRFVEERGLKL